MARLTRTEPMTGPSDSHDSTRRRFLAAGGLLAGTAGLAGCISGTGSKPTATETTDDEPADGQTADGETTEAVAAESPGAAAWPQFGHDASNAGYARSASGPGADAALAWRFDAKTPTMNASPVVADGTVYAPGSGDPGYVHAIDAETGESVWRFEPAGYASCAPAVADGRVYFGTWSKKFYALDAATGEQVWASDVGHRFGSSSPAVSDGTVYVGTVGDGPMVVSGEEDEEKFESCAVLALDAESGDERWRYDDFGEKENVGSSIAVADGRVYFGGESAVYALDADSGSVAWSREVATHPQSSPAVVDGTVYYGGPSDAEDGPPARLYALDAKSGETVWTAGIDDTSLRTSPAVADGTVYVAASSTRACLLSGGGVATTETDDGGNGTDAARTEDGDSDCSGTNRGRLYALDAASGERRWTAEFRTDTRSSPAVADGTVYAGNGDGLSAVTTDGENLWRIGFEGKRDDGPYLDSSPAVAGGRVFVGASDGRLRAIGTK
ncbi:PQQ-binding-like beta-propeller repeat protein [Halorussus gelatinilyticus]|uniref:PQQ-binding-like beta-propeller repeat protein n=1 Tax=Halorussus gelatinilyticus TaxID=2937524 RepID=A0A8U0IKU4_9EURY|nr:PQQ-binding-like beta-propeller repeat protein [Halorussus gelatinilyticus]UPW00834.1 PQQ-binding-like beta-propeller repeat protein [Halorussus gelatinilyticus]